MGQSIGNCRNSGRWGHLLSLSRDGRSWSAVESLFLADGGRHSMLEANFPELISSGHRVKREVGDWAREQGKYCKTLTAIASCELRLWLDSRDAQMHLQLHKTPL
jgi:hypothetical protein